MRLLIISSCTGKKDVRDCPGKLTQGDFDDPARRRVREAELTGWALPARLLYTGQQHRFMMKGVACLRQKFGASSCSVRIVSAGYGLVEEEQSIAPYEATFQRARLGQIRERATLLGIPEAVRSAVEGHECVMFLLGKEYLHAISPLPQPAPGQRFVFFISHFQLPFDPNLTVVPAGRTEARFGAGLISLKGKMFEHLAVELCRRPEMWGRVCSDETPATILNLIEASHNNT
jgi:hypothetical protein